MASVEVPPGISIEWGGEVEEQRKAFRDLSLLLILGVVLVYMVMAGQFEDFTGPFIIMFSVPFAFVGVIWAFALTAIRSKTCKMNILITSYCHLADYTPELTLKPRNIQLTKIKDKIDIMELLQEADIWHIY